MKRHKSLFKLSREHHDGLILAQLLKQDAPQYKGMPHTPHEKRTYALNFFKTHLIGHFKAEEEILFSFGKGKSSRLATLTGELIFQHQNLAANFKLIELENENYVHIMDETGYMLEQHIRLEEREYFQLLQEELSEEELEELGNRLG
ncbi:MAG: hemerythrin domain-containing protein [Ignavibacteriaceae bacterium]|nr:hemerythrin domain-containing protein [Ignavibacteriaceae bacterium]